jgi:hypothetical protein
VYKKNLAASGDSDGINQLSIWYTILLVRSNSREISLFFEKKTKRILQLTDDLCSTEENGKTGMSRLVEEP